MPAPDIIDLDPASDARFRDVYGRHHNRMMSRSGNLIRTLYHHVSGAQSNVSAAEMVSLDASNNAQYDFILRNSTNPINSANLTNANVSTWSASSLLSLRQGTTAIRSANVTMGNLTLTTNSVAKLDNCFVRSFQKVLGGISGNTINICTITAPTNGVYAAELNVVMSSFVYLTISKTYKFQVFNFVTNSEWHRLIPLNAGTSGIFGAEISVTGNQTTLRLVRVASNANSESNNMECTLTVYQSRQHPVTISNSDGTENGVTLSSTSYVGTPLTQVGGRVGIGTDAPSDLLTVAGVGHITGNTWCANSASALASTTGSFLFYRQLLQPCVFRGTFVLGSTVNAPFTGVLQNITGPYIAEQATCVVVVSNGDYIANTGFHPISGCISGITNNQVTQLTVMYTCDNTGAARVSYAILFTPR